MPLPRPQIHLRATVVCVEYICVFGNFRRCSRSNRRTSWLMAELDVGLQFFPLNAAESCVMCQQFLSQPQRSSFQLQVSSLSLRDPPVRCASWNNSLPGRSRNRGTKQLPRAALSLQSQFAYHPVDLQDHRTRSPEALSSFLLHLIAKTESLFAETKTTRPKTLEPTKTKAPRPQTDSPRNFGRRKHTQP